MSKCLSRKSGWKQSMSKTAAVSVVLEFSAEVDGYVGPDGVTESRKPVVMLLHIYIL